MAPAGFLVDEEGKAWDGEDSDDERDAQGGPPTGEQYKETAGLTSALNPEEFLDHDNENMPTPVKARLKRPKVYIDEVMEKANEYVHQRTLLAMLLLIRCSGPLPASFRDTFRTACRELSSRPLSGSGTRQLSDYA